MTAPTYVSEYATAFNTTGSPKTCLNSVSINSGNVLVGMVASEHANEVVDLALTENGSASWQEEQTHIEDAFTETLVSSYVATSDETITVTATYTDSLYWGANVVRFSGTDGIGASNKNISDTGNPSVTLTTTQADSAIVVIVGDYFARSGTGTWTSNGGAGSATPLTGYPGDSDHYGVHIAYYPNAGSVGSKTVGMSTPASMRWTIVAIEVLGSEATTQSYTFTASGSYTYAGTSTVSRVYLQVGLNDLGETALLEYIVGKNASPEQLVYKLFVGSTVPAENSTVGDFVEVAGGGYASKTLVGSSWTVSGGTATHPQLIYTFTGSIDNGPVVGYYVTRVTTGDLIYAERSSFTFNPASEGDAFLIRPTISLD